MSEVNKHLIFVDTNIFLDFYRARRETGLALLKHLDSAHNKAIITCQVEMEFKKNRQRVIRDSLSSLKLLESISPPAFLSESQSAKILTRNITDINKRVKALSKRLKKVLANPKTHDPVYEVTQKIFKRNTDYTLRIDDERYVQIRRAAWDRFNLGYPPRKDKDTSLVDAVNWEWIINCAQRSHLDIVIVSRDSDYGITVGKEAFINDWLLEEFKKRVSRQRNIVLVDRLSQGLRMLKVRVTDEEEKEEQELLEEAQVSPYPPSVLQFFTPSTAHADPELIRTLWKSFLRPEDKTTDNQ